VEGLRGSGGVLRADQRGSHVGKPSVKLLNLLVFNFKLCVFGVKFVFEDCNNRIIYTRSLSTPSSSAISLMVFM
jgi:hypothetical protein